MSTGDFDDLEMMFELRTPNEADLAAPPDLFTVPASTVTLDPGQLVTVGEPGVWWQVDELVVMSGPVTPHEQPEGDPLVGLVPWCEWGSASVRTKPGDLLGVYHRFVPLSQVWVSRPAPEHEGRTVDDLPGRDEHAWMRNRSSDAATPPLRRTPRPARELPSLAGRRLRTRTVTGGWEWVCALGEPVESGGSDTYVPVATLRDYGLALYGRPPSSRWVWRPALHRLWTY